MATVHRISASLSTALYAEDTRRYDVFYHSPDASLERVTFSYEKENSAYYVFLTSSPLKRRAGQKNR